MHKPRIASGVHYLSHGTPIREDGTQAYKAECRAAVVTGTHEGSVDLCAINPEGMFFKLGVVQDETLQQGGTWHTLDACDN